MNRTLKGLAAAVAAATAVTVVGCSSDADVASDNLSKASEQFEVSRRIVAINGVTDKYLFVVEGRCSLEYPENRTEIVCKLDDGNLIKHVVRQSDNVTLIMEQTNGTAVSTDHYRVIFKPEVIIPNVDRP
ncbi:hypothetical protein SEA_MARSHAWN_55 [Mycobacterium phage Marshawn]|uniref:Uncharacterized protein n=1 Tax=Mycobacterium phage Marshawn TaxID=2652423 RepID=A0A5P8D839_9CAUD|nr:site-specific recombination directionality factor RDF [Mycobacterium phage Marshawn]QFP94841.1 hypothetical protein SEA_MARSHAWN_55 [Mycobacterium phage Marshawn]